MQIKTNDFTKRQTPESKYGHFDGSWEELEELTSMCFQNNHSGYRDGVVLVTVPPEKFYTSIIKVDKTTVIETKFEARQEGEMEHVNLTAKNGHKLPASYVEIVLYSHYVLLENDEQTTDAEWEIISINASPMKSKTPMHPITRARNNLCMVGGTDSKYSELSREELIDLVKDMSEGIMFWSNHMQLGD